MTDVTDEIYHLLGRQQTSHKILLSSRLIPLLQKVMDLLKCWYDDIYEQQGKDISIKDLVHSTPTPTPTPQLQTKN